MKLRWKPFNVEIQCQHSLRLLLLSFQTSTLKHLSCHRADRLWQTTVSQSSSLCQRLSALLWTWRAVGRRMCDRLDFHTDQSPFAHSLPSRWCHPPSAAHTHACTQTHAWDASALPLSLSHYLPLFTFLLLHKNNTRHLVRHIEYTRAHTHWHTYKHRPQPHA